MFEMLENGQVLRIREVTTKTQTAVVKEHYAWERKVAISTNSAQINIGDAAVIKFEWQKFNINDGMHKNDPTKNVPITAKINGQEVELIPENGQTILEFSSDEPGTYEITTTTTALETDTITVEVV